MSAEEFEKRTGRTVINWQPHTCGIGKDGDYVWPLAKAYDEMAIRVEADGYQPQIFTGIKKANGAQHIVFLLTEDKGVAGRVLTPDGKPAAGATVAVALAQKDIVWEDGAARRGDCRCPKNRATAGGGHCSSRPTRKAASACRRSSSRRPCW